MDIEKNNCLNTESAVKTRRFIIQLSPNLDVNYFRAYLIQLDVKILREFKRINSFLVTTNLKSLNYPGIKIFKEREFRGCLDDSVPLIKGEDWDKLEVQYNRTINGSGIVVAILDTGIDITHPDLSGSVVFSKSFVENNSSPVDDNGHGTHIAGIIAGRGRVNAYVKGVAPGVKLLNYKVLDYNNRGYESWIISAIEWAVENGSDIINLSLAANETGDGMDPLSQMIDWAISQGVIVCCASGNIHEKYSISKCGTSDLAITVGVSTKYDTIWSNTGGGPTLDLRLKPDILAPGVNILSCKLGGGYIEMSGSSQATAHISGVCALIKQIHPEWTVREVKKALLNGALDLGGEFYYQGAGRVRCIESINATIIATPIINVRILKYNIKQNFSVNITNLGQARLINISPSSSEINFSENEIRVEQGSSILLNFSILIINHSKLMFQECISINSGNEIINVRIFGYCPQMKVNFINSSVFKGFNISYQILMDDIPVNLSYIRGSSFKAQLYDENEKILKEWEVIIVNGSNTYTYYYNPNLLCRGDHNFRIVFKENNETIGEKFIKIKIYGYRPKILMLNLNNISVFTNLKYNFKYRLSYNDTVLGFPVNFYINNSGELIYIGSSDTGLSPSFYFEREGIYEIIIEFNGSSYYEPIVSIYYLTVKGNWLFEVGPIFIFMIIVIIISFGVISALIYQYKYDYTIPAGKFEKKWDSRIEGHVKSLIRHSRFGINIFNKLDMYLIQKKRDSNKISLNDNEYIKDKISGLIRKPKIIEIRGPVATGKSSIVYEIMDLVIRELRNNFGVEEDEIVVYVLDFQTNPQFYYWKNIYRGIKLVKRLISEIKNLAVGNSMSYFIFDHFQIFRPYFLRKKVLLLFLKEIMEIPNSSFIFITDDPLGMGGSKSQGIFSSHDLGLINISENDYLMMESERWACDLFDRLLIHKFKKIGITPNNRIKDRVKKITKGNLTYLELLIEYIKGDKSRLRKLKDINIQQILSDYLKTLDNDALKFYVYLSILQRSGILVPKSFIFSVLEFSDLKMREIMEMSNFIRTGKIIHKRKNGIMEEFIYINNNLQDLITEILQKFYMNGDPIIDKISTYVKDFKILEKEILNLHRLVHYLRIYKRQLNSGNNFKLVSQKIYQVSADLESAYRILNIDKNIEKIYLFIILKYILIWLPSRKMILYH
ncbi:MAG: S8 family serine peptidase [Candidatus Helarchaeota archaeon]